MLQITFLIFLYLLSDFTSEQNDINCYNCCLSHLLIKGETRDNQFYKIIIYEILERLLKKGFISINIFSFINLSWLSEWYLVSVISYSVNELNLYLLCGASSASSDNDHSQPRSLLLNRQLSAQLNYGQTTGQKTRQRHFTSRTSSWSPGPVIIL